MPQLLVIVRDSNNNVIPNATVSWSGGSARSDASGTASLSLTGTTSGQTVSVSASASGFSPSSQNFIVTQYTGTISFSLSSAVSPLTTSLMVTNGTAGVSGAAVFINGNLVGTSSSTGAVLITLANGVNQLQITATGFQPYSASINSSSPPDHVVLTATGATQAQVLTLVSSPPGAAIQIASENSVLDAGGTYTTLNAFDPGNYAVVLSYQGQTSTSQISVVPGTALYQLTPVPVIDSGSGAGLQTVATDGSSAAAPNASQPGTVATSNQASAAPTTIVNGSSSTDTPNYEFVNPSGNFGRYFTATQARMYIGNLFIEELAGCQFVLQGNKVPIYGYASEAFDAIGTGKYLVQGQIMVHFISEGYLYTVLNEYKKLNSTPAGSNQQTFQNLINTQQQLESGNTSDPAIQSQIAAIQKQRQLLLASDPTLASTYKRQLLANSSTVVGPNATYQNVPFDLVLELEGGGRTVTRRITNCVITSNEQIYGDNDTPLIDSYGFIGRRLR